MNNLDVRDEHGQAIVGHVIDTYLTKDNEWYARFELNDSLLGELHINL